MLKLSCPLLVHEMTALPFCVSLLSELQTWHFSSPVDVWTVRRVGTSDWQICIVDKGLLFPVMAPFHQISITCVSSLLTV